jgi:hypothetical protein
MTTYITDFFVDCFTDQYEMHDADGDLPDLWGCFCSQGTTYDQFPNWKEECIKEWAEDILDNDEGWAKLSPFLKNAIWKDLDLHHLKTVIMKSHAEWFDTREEHSEASDESSDDEQTDPLPSPPVENAASLVDVNPPEPDGDGIAD